MGISQTQIEGATTIKIKKLQMTLPYQNSHKVQQLLVKKLNVFPKSDHLLTFGIAWEMYKLRSALSRKKKQYSNNTL